MDGDQTSSDAFLEFRSTPLSDRRPFVLETQHAISLHFDYLATQSCMSLRAPDRLALGYTRTMMGFLLLKPDPQRICMIGLGGGSLAKYCYRHLPAVDITVVEINPEVISLRDVFRIPADDARFRVVCADGADYVRNGGVAKDVILVDAYVAGGISSQCADIAFFCACRERLADTGVLVVNFTDDEPALAICVDLMKAVFGSSYAVVRCADDSNFVVFAWKSRYRLPSARVLLDRAISYAWADDLKLSSVARRLKGGEDLDSGQLIWQPQGHARWEFDHSPGVSRSVFEG
ncbi:spermidine synthase [Paraburkholderia sp. A2WS-5]|uniref:spermine/spermidine synthase domain-containing protein n=1 Tax=unclassified Paraburkholderia TaxID=2615204 RepID=UPI003B7EBC67